MKELVMVVNGRVQGVSFRYTVKKKAEQEGLTGHVQNNPNGTVTITLQGDEPVLERFEAWVLSSPGFSDVRETKRGIREVKRAYEDFRVIRERNIFKDQVQSLTNLGRSLK